MVRPKKSAVFLYLTFIWVVAVFFTPLEAGKKIATGIVFADSNRNGRMEPDEKGIAGVVVSNQLEVVETNDRGEFRLPVGEKTIIFVSKPSGYDNLLDENNLPRFYYLHYPKGSPAGLGFKGIEPTGKLPQKIFFPLVKAEVRDTFNAIVMGDPQTKTEREIGFFRDQVVTKLLGNEAAFYLDLGDVMYDDLSLYPSMNKVLAKVGVPIYHVMGNHDVNYKALDYTEQAETFRSYYGPDYYSFNYGKVHVVVLNTVKYEGWDPVANKKRTEYGYTGGIHPQQMAWLERDLAFVPADYLILLAMHIPFTSRLETYDLASTSIVNRQDLFKILENRKSLLAVAGHMHFIEYMVLDSADGWQGKAFFPSLTAGAGCGTWWHGPKDMWGLPMGLATDGSPSGYFRLAFAGNQYMYRFVSVGTPADEQMRINSPMGTLAQHSLQNQRINVNVFAGTPDTRVSFRLDGNAAVGMERKIMEDPFYAQLIKNNPTAYLEWMAPTPCAHIWDAPLPTDLRPGIHRLDILVADPQGNTFVAHRLLEIQ